VQSFEDFGNGVIGGGHTLILDPDPPALRLPRAYGYSDRVRGRKKGSGQQYCLPAA
jgi:hypothetical protein